MGLAIELFTNLYQCILFIGFLYLFFEKPQGKLKRAVPFIIAATVFFGIESFFTLTGMHTGPDSYYIDSVLYVAVMEIYSLLCLKGKIYQKIMMPLIAFGINALIAYNFVFLAGAVSGRSIEESLTVSTGFRYLCLVVINLTTTLLLWLILRVGSKRVRLASWSEIISFAVIPFLCMVILYCAFFIINISGFDSDIVPYLLIICVVMLVISILTCVMLVRISKVNAIRTDYLLVKQREKLYEENTISTNNQIEKISSVRHDMKNKLMSIKSLISQGDIDKAIELCDNTSDTLEGTYTPINSTNPILNAIINVELEKAASAGIDFSAEISDPLDEVSSSDVVSLIGNLCDNAIEYLSDKPKEIRRMSLHIHSQLNYSIITCKNRISGSVLKDNPRMLTTKEDKSNHGIGLSTIKRIVKDYDGEVMINEEDGWILVSIMLCQD